VAGARVLLERNDERTMVETITGVDGKFLLSAGRAGIYTVRAEKSGVGSALTGSFELRSAETTHVDLVLTDLVATHPTGSSPPPASTSSASSSSSSGAMQFADQPNFTVAGITDWTAAGGHGSDNNLRTSEALVKDTLALQSSLANNRSAGPPPETRRHGSELEKKLRASWLQAQGSFEANHQLGEFYCESERYREATPLLEAAYHINPADHSNAYDLTLAYRGDGEFARAREQVEKMLAGQDQPNLHRLLGDLDEQLNDPLAAVREYEQAARLEPSEPNYFEWGTELLLHRAILPAVEVFRKGSVAHPDSERMLAGLGVALYASGSYQEAARRLCQASDFKPIDPTPYLFLGKMEMAAPEPLPCVEEKLARFVEDQPGNARGNYYEAVALWKRGRGLGNLATWQQVVTLLQKAVAVDPSFDQAYLQLGILYAARGEDKQAIPLYQQAIALSPGLGEAHYRLALAYKRMGEQSKAQAEFARHEQVEKTEAATIERERRELQQFVVILKDQPAASSAR